MADVKKFEDLFIAYYKSRKDFENSTLKPLVEYGIYINAMEECINIFLELIEALNLNYNEVVKEELRGTILNMDTQLRSLMTETFVTNYYNDFDSKVVFLCNLIITKQPTEDLTEFLVDIGDVILDDRHWGLINLVLEALSFFNDEQGLVLVDKVIRKLVSEKGFYHGELGNNIMLCLMNRPGKRTYNIIMKYQDIPIEAFSRIFHYLKNKMGETTGD